SFKQLITRSLTLKLFDPQALTIIFSDASLKGGASIILQPEVHNNKTLLFPISFLSVRFNPTQQRYSTVERELFSVLPALNKGELLLSPDVTVYTDNKGIISIGNSDRNTHPRFTKYLDLVNGHRVKWKYLPGAKNLLADYLSRFGLDDQPYLDLEQLQQFAVDIPTSNLTLLSADSDAETSSTTNPEPSTEAPNSDNTTDPDYVIDNVNSLTLSQLLEIQKLLADKISSIPPIFSKIIDRFYYTSGNLYINMDSILFRVVIDKDYMDVATKLHALYHCTHRVLQLAMADEKLWNPNSNLLLLV
ncbi:Tkp3 protein, partial [Vanderwaltozyma polyspora DSM 70294]